MNKTFVSAFGCKLFIGHIVAALDGRPVGIAKGNVTRRIFIEERIVEKDSALADGRTVGYQCYFSQAGSVLVGFDELAQIVLALPCRDFYRPAVLKGQREIF